MFEAGLSFGMFAIGMLFSFILICVCVFVAKVFWKKFKSFACFEIKIQNKDYTEDMILEQIVANEKRLKFLYALRGKR